MDEVAPYQHQNNDNNENVNIISKKKSISMILAVLLFMERPV